MILLFDISRAVVAALTMLQGGIGSRTGSYRETSTRLYQIL